MESIPRYIHNRHHPDQVRYRHPMLEPILRVTYGCIVYQEQVMQIFRELAGYSLGRADLVRRAMSKKKHDVMEKERQIFIHGLTDENGRVEVDGCVRRGVPEATADAIFNEMSSFASYAFNKSHAARLCDGGVSDGLAEVLLSAGVYGGIAHECARQRQGGGLYRRMRADGHQGFAAVGQ